MKKPPLTKTQLVMSPLLLISLLLPLSVFANDAPLIDGGLYRMKNLWGGTYLGGTNTANGANVEVTALNPEWNSLKWRAIKEGNFYRFECQWGKLYLTSFPNGGANVILSTLKPASATQQWAVEQVAGNTVRLRCRAGGLYLHATGGEPASNVVVINLNEDYNSQQWTLEYIAPEGSTSPVTSRRNEFNWLELAGDYRVKSWASPGHQGTNYLEWNDPLTYLRSEFSSTTGGQNGWVGYEKNTTPGYPQRVSTLDEPVTVGFTSQITDLIADPAGARIFVGAYGWNHGEDVDWSTANGWEDEWYVWSWSNATPSSVVGGLTFSGADRVGEVEVAGQTYSLFKIVRNNEFSGLQWHAVPESWDAGGLQVDVLPILKEWVAQGMQDYLMVVSVEWETLWGANSGTIIFSDINLPRFDGAITARAYPNEETVSTSPNGLLSVYPSPTTHMLTVEWDHEAPNAIAVMDFSGRFIKEVRGQKTVNVTTLPPGVYLLRVVDGEGHGEMAKFIKE